MEKTWCVYIHRNKINGKVYIGQTCQQPREKRWRNGHGYNENPHFYSAIIKYGWDNFEHIIYKDNLTQEQADELESNLIKQFNSMNDNYGYNMTSGGDHPKLSKESKEKISNALKGKPLSQEHKKKLSEAAKRRKTPHFSEEHKKKIGEHQKKKVLCIETGMIFDTVTEAAEWAGLNDHRNLSSYLTKKRGKSAGKHPVTKQPLHWKYFLEGEEENAN